MFKRFIIIFAICVASEGTFYAQNIDYSRIRNGPTYPVIGPGVVKVDGTGASSIVTGTSTNCVHVDGTSATCPGGSSNPTNGTNGQGLTSNGTGGFGTPLTFSPVATSGSASDLNAGTLPHARLPTLLSGDIPNNAANTSGLAATATALATAPTKCSAGSYTIGINVLGVSQGCTVLAAIATSGSATDLITGTIPNARIVALPHANIAATAVTPGAYTNANITIAADGSVTAAANGSSSGCTTSGTNVQKGNGTGGCAASSIVDNGTTITTTESINGVTPTTFGFLDPTSSVQTQLNTKAPLASPTFTGTVTIPSGAGLATPATMVGTNLTGTGASFTAGKATALATTPTLCGSGFATSGVDTGGNATGCVVTVPTGANNYPPVSATSGALISIAPITIAPTTTPGNVAGIVTGAATQGQVFLFQTGVYKNQTWTTSADDQQFICPVDQRCQMINSTDITASWTGAGPYSRTITVTDHDDMYPCVATFTCNLDVDLFYDSVPQIRIPFVTNCATTAPSAGHWAYNGTTACSGSNPSGHTIEINDYTYPNMITGGNSGILVSGFIIRKYPTAAQNGAIGGSGPGPNWKVENCDIQLSHGVAVTLRGGKVINSTLNNNGQEGFNMAYAAGDVFAGNKVNYNNYAHYDYDAEAGAGKFGRERGIWIHDNEFGWNIGVGPWCDTDCNDAMIEDNNVHDNTVNGIMWEISRSCTIRNNHVKNNGGALNAGYQIFISTSGPCDIYGNDISWNKANIYYGVYILDDTARMHDDNMIPWRGLGNRVRNNYFTCGGAASGCAAIFGNYTTAPTNAATITPSIQADWNMYYDLGTPGGIYFQINGTTYNFATWISTFGEDINAQSN